MIFATGLNDCVQGVHGFYCAKDVPGDNNIGDIVHDEEVFASKVSMVGR